MEKSAEKGNAKVELPTVLAFERKLEVSDAYMYAGTWGDDSKPDEAQVWDPIKITKRQNRSTQSSYKISDTKKSQPNPVASDSDDANLPKGKDTLRVSFTLRIIGNLGMPFACNNPRFEKDIKAKVGDFKRADGSGLRTLAHRYAYNIANGRFLWRNRVCAEKVMIRVDLGSSDSPLWLSAHEFSLNDFEKGVNDEGFKKLGKMVQDGLTNEDNFAFLKVSAYVKLGDSQHVFPSQEMNMNEKGKVLFQLDECAAIHNVKIGNALRTVDNWYKEGAEIPIAAEPFGAVTQKGEAFRKKTNDLYTLMMRWVSGAELSEKDKNFVVANLVRGGVFGGKNE